MASAPASCWNYSWSGAYFITICTQNRSPYFGEIQDGKMILSNCGVLADLMWHEIPHHAKHCELGAFVVMPNHIHGILILNNPGLTSIPEGIGTGTLPSIATLPAINDVVETLHATSLRAPTGTTSQTNQSTPTPISDKNQMAQISPQANSVSTIMRSYKSAVTKHANRLGFAFNWQTRFYDHIIRNDAEFQRVNDYIENNPSSCMQDKFFRVDQ